jgi:hypothetical protein
MGRCSTGTQIRVCTSWCAWSDNHLIAFLPTVSFTQGWSGLDDAIKHGRGTSTGKVFSSMAQPADVPQAGSTLQPLYATHPNETRLQELLNLQRRKLQQMPGPGTYEVRAGSM